MDRSPEAKQAFANFLKEARERLGMNKTEMARELGLDMKLYWLYEAAKSLPKTNEAKERIEGMVQILLAELEEQEKVAPQETKVAPQETPEVAPVEKSPPVEEREPILREPLYEDKTVHEQLQDLGVEVVTVSSLGLRPDEDKPAKKGVTNIRWYNPSRPANYLLDVISITQNNITVGHKVAEMLGGDGVFLKIGCADRNGAVVPTFTPVKQKEKNTLLLRRDKNKNSYRISSSSSIKWLLAEGVKVGRYRIKQLKNVENTFLGVPEGDLNA